MSKENSQVDSDRSVKVDEVLRSTDGSSAKLIQITQREGFVTVETGRYEVDGESIVCLSSQIGCAMGCNFCRSGEPYEYYPGRYQRVLRNLSPQEIVDQAVNGFEMVPAPLASIGKVFSYMGMGEPFANLPAVKESVLVLDMNYPQSRATISTIGIDLLSIKKLAGEIVAGNYPIPIKLHVSLHSPIDEQRHQLIPHALPIAETVDAAAYFSYATHTDVKLNYVLIAGFNNSDADVERLRELLRNRPGLVLKISDLNSNKAELVVPAKEADLFEAKLNGSGIKTERFRSKGLDVQAGCGQLVKGKIAR